MAIRLPGPAAIGEQTVKSRQSQMVENKRVADESKILQVSATRESANWPRNVEKYYHDLLRGVQALLGGDGTGTPVA